MPQASFPDPNSGRLEADVPADDFEGKKRSQDGDSDGAALPDISADEAMP